MVVRYWGVFRPFRNESRTVRKFVANNVKRSPEYSRRVPRRNAASFAKSFRNGDPLIVSNVVFTRVLFAKLESKLDDHAYSSNRIA